MYLHDDFARFRICEEYFRNFDSDEFRLVKELSLLFGPPRPQFLVKCLAPVRFRDSDFPDCRFSIPFC